MWRSPLELVIATENCKHSERFTWLAHFGPVRYATPVSTGVCQTSTHFAPISATKWNSRSKSDSRHDERHSQFCRYAKQAPPPLSETPTLPPW